MTDAGRFDRVGEAESVKREGVVHVRGVLRRKQNGRRSEEGLCRGFGVGAIVKCGSRSAQQVGFVVIALNFGL